MVFAVVVVGVVVVLSVAVEVAICSRYILLFLVLHVAPVVLVICVMWLRVEFLFVLVLGSRVGHHHVASVGSRLM